VTDTDHAISELRALCGWFLVHGIRGAAWADVCKALGWSVQGSFDALISHRPMSKRKTNAIVARYKVLKYEAAKEALRRIAWWESLRNGS